MEGRLLDALAMGRTETLQILYAENRSILEQKTTEEDTPLHLASRFNHTELVSTILQWQPIMAIATNSKKDTPLHDACRVGGLAIVKLLLDARPFAAYMLNTDKESAFVIACSLEHEIVATELSSRMNFGPWDEISASCLRIAASKGFTEIVKKILKENPSSASRKDDDGFSAMHLASREGKDEVIKTLIEKDRSNLSFLKDNDERTPLHSAVIANQLSVVEAFLSPSSLNSVQVADLINRADKDGNAVLHLAAINDNVQIIKLLLARTRHLPPMRRIKVRKILRCPKMARNVARLAREPSAASGPRIGAGKVNDANNEGTSRELVKNNRTGEAEKDASTGRLNAEGADISDDTSSLDPRPDPISQTTMQETSLNNVQQALMVVAGLIVTLTFQAGLNPPGGFWQDGNQTNHKPGKAIQSETNLLLFTVFLACNALGFISSLVLIPLIMCLKTNTLWYVNSLVVMALVSVEVAFIIGLIMISDRKPLHHVEIFLLIFVTLASIVWAKWKHAQLKSCNASNARN